MKLTSNTKVSKTTRIPRLAESEYGTPQPTILLEVPEGTPHRRCNALLHRLAAVIEEATPDREKWIVQVDRERGAHGGVYLELAEGDQGEAERGLAVLDRIGRIEL